jgi:hypothetical protein
MRVGLAGIVAATAVVVPAVPLPAAAAAPQVLVPSSPWHLDYSPDSCNLALVRQGCRSDHA